MSGLHALVPRDVPEADADLREIGRLLRSPISLPPLSLPEISEAVRIGREVERRLSRERTFRRHGRCKAIAKTTGQRCRQIVVTESEYHGGRFGRFVNEEPDTCMKHGRIVGYFKDRSRIDDNLGHNEESR